MKGNKFLDYIVLGILFLFLTVALILVPSEKSIGFWIAYGFTAVSFIAQFYIVNRSKGKANRIRTKFLGMPLLLLAMLYAAAQILLLAVLAVMPQIETWVCVVSCTAILLVFGYFILTADYSSIDDNDDVFELSNTHGDRNRHFSLDVLYDDVKKCAQYTSDEKIKQSLSALCQKINESSNIRTAETLDIEKRILSKVDTLQNATHKDILIEEISELLDDRNSICKSI